MPEENEKRRKGTSAIDADVLLRLVRKLSDDGIRCRTVSVGSITVEIVQERPQPTPIVREEREAGTYAQRALDRRAKELIRAGGLPKDS